MYQNKLLQRKSLRRSLLASLRKVFFRKGCKTAEHPRAVQDLALQMGRALGLSQKKLENLALLTQWHYLGNFALPEEIMQKNETLTTEEQRWIQKQPEIECRISESSSERTSVADLILSHHERWDANGYPLALCGEEIPPCSRIVSIAGAYEVMACGRPFKKGVSSEEAREEICRGAGTQFDFRIAKVFLTQSSRPNPM